MPKFGRSAEVVKLEDITFKPNALEGLNIVVTGALEHFSRKDIASTIRELGGLLKDSVNSKTSLLLVGGESVGSKYQKAKELDVKIIDENEFINMIADGDFADQTL